MQLRIIHTCYFVKFQFLIEPLLLKKFKYDTWKYKDVWTYKNFESNTCILSDAISLIFNFFSTLTH